MTLTISRAVAEHSDIFELFSVFDEFTLEGALHLHHFPVNTALIGWKRKAYKFSLNSVSNFMAKKKKPTKPRSAPGPKPDVLKLKGPWQAAVRKSFEKKKPAEGWPK
jgi:hypothetical protein